ncbi:MAG: DUF3987 domain-containing protein, partial [Emcibacter sp.]|nr:DUF3987 domain-containing protein [Emcibacter sp.]
MIINLPESHPTLGKPTKIYPYRNREGQIYAAAYRFDGQEGKTFRPYDAIRNIWQFPESPEPYNLENLNLDSEYSDLNPKIPGDIPGFPNNSVIIVEGEKCVDSLRHLGFSAMTSLGGSGQAGKTDWNTLKGRHVIIWPDHDDPGLKYAKALKVALRNVGVASLCICNVSYVTLRRALSVDSSTLRNVENSATITASDSPITRIDNLPKGWDVADAIEEGWRQDHIQAFLNEAIPVNLDFQDIPPQNSANDNEGWPEPDLSILATDVPPPPFPVGIFSPLLTDWLLKTAEGRAAPVDYVAGTLLSSAASLIGNTRKVSPWQDWSEPCILWIALVGSPSSGKSPAMDPVLDQVKKLEADDIPDYEEMLRQHEADKLEAGINRANWEQNVKIAQEEGYPIPIMPEDALEPDPPQRPRLIIRDATTEALSHALQGQPKGLLMHRDELAGWFASFDRYSGGKGGDRAYFLECFGGKAFTQDRVKNGATPITIPHLSVSVIGSIQPDRLQSCLMKGDDDGLSSRFLYIYPQPVKRRRPRQMANKDTIERTMRKLHSLKVDMGEDYNPVQRVISLSSEATDYFEIWWQDQGEACPTGKSGGWHGKMGGVALRLSLILTYLEWASGYNPLEPYEITLDTVQKAIQLIDHYLTPMAERA